MKQRVAAKVLNTELNLQATQRRRTIAAAAARMRRRALTAHLMHKLDTSIDGVRFGIAGSTFQTAIEALATPSRRPRLPR